MLTIKVKIIVAYTLVFGALLCVFAYLVYESSLRAEIAKLDSRMESHAEKLQTEIEEQSSEDLFPRVDELRDIATEGLSGVQLCVLDSAGRVVFADSLLSQTAVGSFTLLSTRAKSYSSFRQNHRRYRLLVEPVEVDGRYPFSLMIAAPMTEAHVNLAHLRLLIFISIPAALVLTSLAAYLITRSAFRPISSIVVTAQQISASSLSRRLTVPGARDEIRQLAESLNSMIERIDQAFKSQRQFIADASHELRTPLTIICSELEFAKRRIADATAIESLQTSLSEIDHMARMVEDLLLLARLDSAYPTQPFALVRFDELLLECVQLVTKIAEGKQVKISVQIDQAAEVLADSDRLKGAVLNLLDNAVRYCGDNGFVSASLRASKSPAGKVQLIIADNGPGISPDDLPHIFERFYRAGPHRNEESGSGLGLAIAHKVIELHQGTLTVSSKQGVGSEFTVMLPLASSQDH